MKKSKSGILKKIPLQIVCLALLLVVSIFLLYFNNTKQTQSQAAMYPKVEFVGEYKIEDGPWQNIEKGKHISSTKGDVTLKGVFHLVAYDGEFLGIAEANTPLAFYLDHINLTVYESGYEPFQMDNENPLFGSSACGQSWLSYELIEGGEKPIELFIHNPHRFGNENAIDEMLSNLSVWSGLVFEKDMLEIGHTQRNLGIIFVMCSLVLIGIALYSTLLHMKTGTTIWLLGFTVLSAGAFFLYSSPNIYFWSDAIEKNTMFLGFSMIFYMLILCMLITNYLNKSKKIGSYLCTALCAILFVLLLLPLFTKILFYDVWLVWNFIQSIICIAFLIFIVIELLDKGQLEKGHYIFLTFPLFAFVIDVLLTFIGVGEYGYLSRIIFVLLFIVVLFMVLRDIPNSINASVKAKQLELEKMELNAELAQSRVSTMISQIRPHFIYNALGSIEQLCEVDPPKAAKLVHNFSKYLRGNFRELDNPKPIYMSQEMEHVRHYISIENVRFPDMVFTFEMNAEDFKLPALTIQPIVENAIKHGLMKLEKGGEINVRSFESDTHYYVCVEDNGVGFDTTILFDERKHIGIRNIKGRLEAMVNGTLEIESIIGKGTKVTIKIPKEEKE